MFVSNNNSLISEPEENEKDGNDIGLVNYIFAEITTSTEATLSEDSKIETDVEERTGPLGATMCQGQGVLDAHRNGSD